MKDPYQILGIPSSASADAIKQAYRKLARTTHPDTKPGDSRAEDRFKEISSAYAVLGDKSQRIRFDRGEIDMDGNTTGFGSGFGAGFGSKTKTQSTNNTGRSGKSRFDHFFKDRQRARQSNMKAKGADVSYTLTVPFMEAALGADKTVRMTNGKSIKLKMPAATEEGQVLRLKGQGMTGLGGGKSGDALVEINIAPDPEFTNKGLDVYSELAIGIDEALLGGKIKAKTMHGIVSITVPQGSNTDTVLRLKKRGICKPNGTSGDHYLKLKVMLPQRPDKTFTDFIRNWTRAHPYDARANDTKKTAADNKTTAEAPPKRKVNAAE